MDLQGVALPHDILRSIERDLRADNRWRDRHIVGLLLHGLTHPVVDTITHSTNFKSREGDTLEIPRAVYSGRRGAGRSLQTLDAFDDVVVKAHQCGVANIHRDGNTRTCRKRTLLG